MLLHFPSFKYNTLQLQGHNDDDDQQIRANGGGRGGLNALGSKVEGVASKLCIIHTTDDGWR